MKFNGHFLCGCFFLHFEQNMARVLSNSIYFCFTWSVSICAYRVLRILLLKLSSIFPISTFMTPPQDTFVNRIPYFFLPTPLEHRMHRTQMVLKSSFDMSPFPTMFNNSKEFSLKTRRRIIFKMSLSKVE